MPIAAAQRKLKSADVKIQVLNAIDTFRVIIQFGNSILISKQPLTTTP